MGFHGSICNSYRNIPQVNGNVNITVYQILDVSVMGLPASFWSVPTPWLFWLFVVLISEVCFYWLYRNVDDFLVYVSFYLFIYRIFRSLMRSCDLHMDFNIITSGLRVLLRIIQMDVGDRIVSSQTILYMPSIGFDMVIPLWISNGSVFHSPSDPHFYSYIFISPPIDFQSTLVSIHQIPFRPWYDSFADDLWFYIFNTFSVFVFYHSICLPDTKVSDSLQM